MHIWILLLIVISLILAYRRANLFFWVSSFFLIFALHTYFTPKLYIENYLQWLIIVGIFIILTVPPIRRVIFSKFLFDLFRRQLPHMSRTEQEALEAGTISFEGELFSGMPNWQKLMTLKLAELSEEEIAFLEGPVTEVCGMVDDWQVSHVDKDLPPAVWKFLKAKGFFGLIIPKKFGGKEFSATAHSAVLAKLYARCVVLGSTVAVPNSLGPAELLLHYGTDKQKKYYLPRLATGKEIPCFALTNPEAGSDASSIPDYGIVCKGIYEGKEVLGMRLNWNKRYITLAPVATVLGLAFKLYDPDHLIGNTENIGITCALIPTNTPGVQIGRRHLPTGAPFQNGPTQGKDVFVPIDWIIGGKERAGQGWEMLMECLSAGRGITLPSSALGNAELATFTSSAYARIRKQFNLAIGLFEGVEEALANIAADTYQIQAALKFMLTTIDHQEKPAVLSGILKYHATELGRRVINNALDIHAGKAVITGPRNYLISSYQSMPIGITVEGANILTRNLIIFGQGAMRCHPYLYREMQAAKNPDMTKGLIDFDHAIFGHIGFVISNFVRTLFLGFTNGHFAHVPQVPSQRYFQQLTRYSAAFAFVADVTMITFGGELKRKERISARLGDILRLLFVGSAVLKLDASEDYPVENKFIIPKIMEQIIFQIQTAFAELFSNFSNRVLGWTLSLLVFPLGKRALKASDKLDHNITKDLINPSDLRARLTRDLFLKDIPNNPLALLEKTFIQVIDTANLDKRFGTAKHDHKLQGYTFEEQVASAVKAKIFTEAEATAYLKTHEMCIQVITVDDFAKDGV